MKIKINIKQSIYLLTGILLVPIGLYLFGLFNIPDIIEYRIDVDNINGKNSSVVNIDFDTDIAYMSLKIVSDKDPILSDYDYRIYSGGKWLDWSSLIIDDDLPNDEKEFFSKFHFLRDARGVQLRFQNEDRLDFKNLELFAFPRKMKFGISFDSAFANGDVVKIVTRNEWGADESFRFYDPDNPPPTPKKYVQTDPDWIKKYADEIKIVKIEDTDKETGKKLIWPFEYTENVEKVVLHHSAGRTPDCGEEQEFLRSIYKFHAVVRGWGDIGYNYVIGPCSGKIYQGRAGSWGVKGAHVGKFNAKTIGIMIMGNFQDKTPPKASIDSVVNLYRFLGEKYGFWPDGWGEMRGLNLPNIVGHRSVANTTCPGDMLEAYLPEIRRRAAEGFKFPRNPFKVLTKRSDIIANNIRESFAADPIMTNTTQLFLKPGEEEDVVITFKNAGKRIWGKKTYLSIDGMTLGLTFNDKKGSEDFVTQKEATVAPGRISSFRIKIKADEKLKSGNYVFSFVPILNGTYKAKDGAYRFAVIIVGDRKNISDDNIVETSYVDAIHENFILDSQVDQNNPVDDIGKNTAEKKTFITPKIKSENNKFLSKTVENFIDIDNGNIFYTYIQDLKKAGIVSGQDGKFYPEREITRGEFSKMLVNASKLEKTSLNRSFSDIAGTTFENFIRILQGHKIVKGQNGKFNPNMSLTRAEAIKMVVNAFNIDGKTDHVFKDVVDSVFESYILKAASVGIIGKGSIFDPDAPITRDQVAKILSKARRLNGTGNDEGDSGQARMTGAGDDEGDSGQARMTGVGNDEGDSGQARMTESVYDGDDGPIVRVDLNFLEKDFILSSNGVFAVYSGDDLIKEDLMAGSEIVVKIKNSKYELKIEDKIYNKTKPIRVVQKSGKIIELIGKNRLGGSVPYNKYRGTIEVRIDPENKGKLYAINELPLEIYLAGLGEEPGNEPEEKIKTVLVMARSYIEYYRQKGGKFPKRFVDLKSDGATSQVYLGYDFESRNKSIPKFTKETKGEVLTYDGKVIRSPYFSQSGGHTITPGTEGNNWNPNAFPFAKRVEDPWSCGKDLDYLEKNGPIECPDKRRGHGIGLSAWGARKMAEEGKGYKEIIRYYLSGVEFEKIY